MIKCMLWFVYWEWQWTDKGADAGLFISSNYYSWEWLINYLNANWLTRIVWPDLILASALINEYFVLDFNAAFRYVYDGMQMGQTSIATYTPRLWYTRSGIYRRFGCHMLAATRTRAHVRTQPTLKGHACSAHTNIHMLGCMYINILCIRSEWRAFRMCACRFWHFIAACTPIRYARWNKCQINSDNNRTKKKKRLRILEDNNQPTWASARSCHWICTLKIYHTLLLEPQQYKIESNWT